MPRRWAHLPQGLTSFNYHCSDLQAVWDRYDKCEHAQVLMLHDGSQQTLPSLQWYCCFRMARIFVCNCQL